jgi:hypothetical protein
MEDCLFSDFWVVFRFCHMLVARAALYKYVRPRVLQSIMHIATTTIIGGDTTVVPSCTNSRTLPTHSLLAISQCWTSSYPAHARSGSDLPPRRQNTDPAHRE